MSSNVSLSCELIMLMGWLLKNEKKQLGKLIKNAINHGLAEEIEQLSDQDYHSMSDQLHATLLDFLLHIEQLLLDQLEEVPVDEQTKLNLTPTLERIDPCSIDVKTLWTSLHKVKAELAAKAASKDEAEKTDAITDATARRLLYKHILECWNPEGGLN